MKRLTLIGIVLIIGLLVGACGEPELAIDKKPKNEYLISYSGNTEDKAKVSYLDDSHQKKSVKVEKDGKFELLFNRLTSNQEYTISTELDGKTTKKKITVKEQPTLINYSTFEASFNSLIKDFPIDITIPSTLPQSSEIEDGFSITTDGNNIMAINLMNLSSNDSGIQTTYDFSYCMSVIASILGADNNFTKITQTMKSAIDNGSAKVTVNGVVYDMAALKTLGNISINLSIYPSDK